MDRSDIERTVAALDAAVLKDGARVAINQYGGGPDECVVVANERGYQRLGIELLKAAYAPAGVGDQAVAIPVDVEYLFDDNSDVQLDWFERREPDARPATGSWDASSLAAMALGLALVATFVIGCYTVVTFVVSLFTAH